MCIRDRGWGVHSNVTRTLKVIKRNASRLRESEGKLRHCCLSTLSQLLGNHFNHKDLQSFKEHCWQKYIPVHCPWRYLCESALFCFGICHLAIPLTCFLYVCQVQMENRNFKSYTVQHLLNKMKKLRQKYKQEKHKSSRNGTGKRKKNWSSLTLSTEHWVTNHK